MEKKRRIVIATGGTGGHIFPAVALSDFLENKYKIEIFSDKRGLKYFQDKKKINLINSGTIYQKNLIKALINLFKIFFFLKN